MTEAKKNYAEILNTMDIPADIIDEVLTKDFTLINKPAYEAARIYKTYLQSLSLEAQKEGRYADWDATLAEVHFCDVILDNTTAELKQKLGNAYADTLRSIVNKALIILLTKPAAREAFLRNLTSAGSLTVADPEQYINDTIQALFTARSKFNGVANSEANRRNTLVNTFLDNIKHRADHPLKPEKAAPKDGSEDYDFI